MGVATFLQYENELYSFLFEGGIQIDFDEISPKALYKYNLKTNQVYVKSLFKLSFSEVVDDKTNAIIYRIDSLLLV